MHSAWRAENKLMSGECRECIRMLSNIFTSVKFSKINQTEAIRFLPFLPWKIERWFSTISISKTGSKQITSTSSFVQVELPSRVFRQKKSRRRRKNSFVLSFFTESSRQMEKIFLHLLSVFLALLILSLKRYF